MSDSKWQLPVGSSSMGFGIKKKIVVHLIWSGMVGF